MVTAALLGAAMVAGCGAAADDVASDEASEDQVGDVSEVSEALCGTTKGAATGRWTISAAIGTIAATQKTPIIGWENAPVCVDGASGTVLNKALRASIKTKYPTLFGTTLQCDNLGSANKVCRDIAGGGGNQSMHAAGRAIDLFFPPDTSSIDPATGVKYVVDGKAKGTNGDNTKADAVANWLIQNAATLHVQRVIWDRSIWSAGKSATREYTGTAPHNNHVHVEVTHDSCTDPKAAACTKLTWLAQ